MSEETESAFKPVPQPSPQPSPLGEPLVDPNASYDLEPVQAAPPPAAVVPPPAPARAPEPVIPANTFIKPGLGSAQVIGIAGATVLAIAVGFATVLSWNAGTRWWANGLLTAYLGLLHAGTGAAAVGFVAFALGREIGNVPLAAARMLLAVSLFLLTIHSGIAIPLFFLFLCAFLLYGLATLILFRLEMSEWAGVVSVHAALWLVMYLAAILQVAVSATPGAIAK